MAINFPATAGQATDGHEPPRREGGQEGQSEPRQELIGTPFHPLRKARLRGLFYFAIPCVAPSC